MRRVRPILILGLAAAIGLGAAACGEGEDGTPVACLDGKGAYLGALGEAPAEVKLSGEVPISDCLAENQASGELATVGTTMLAVATQLNDEARREPGGSAAVQLGYLLGAVERGAGATEGIHADLLRRLEAAARYSPTGSEPPSAPFQRAYERGHDAGLTDG
ncbi:MAG TPA: hypothetical protein VF729_04420 [Solirubrobacterales bacterium]